MLEVFPFLEPNYDVVGGFGGHEMADESCYSHNGNGIVIEDGWDIFGGEFVGRVTDEETCLAHSTITDNHTSRRVRLALSHFQM
jgi:hypothetical protein